MYTCEEQDIVSLVDSICEVLMDEDLQDLYDYKWGCITKKVLGWGAKFGPEGSSIIGSPSGNPE